MRIGALVGAAAGHAVLAKHLDAHPGALGGDTASAGEAQVQAAHPRSGAGPTSPATADPAAARRPPGGAGADAGVN